MVKSAAAVLLLACLGCNAKDKAKFIAKAFYMPTGDFGGGGSGDIEDQLNAWAANNLAVTSQISTTDAQKKAAANPTSCDPLDLDGNPNDDDCPPVTPK